MAASDEIVALFISIGLSEEKAKETVKNDTLKASLCSYIEEVCLVKVSTLYEIYFF